MVEVRVEKQKLTAMEKKAFSKVIWQVVQLSILFSRCIRNFKNKVSIEVTITFK
ncbi:MAG: hypothetical protein PHQ52_02760 [Candidatus Omnitrophica bacterium]|nr:hypothetical protein [Candidatus Omnitrophota bacterium]